MLAAAKAGVSERSARRIEVAVELPSQSPRRYWRSRPNPFAEVWDSEVVPLLKRAPTLLAVTLLRKLQDDHPEDFPDGVLRTLQRHIRQWRALEGPPKEVFFPQDHAPGHRGLSDFTAMAALRITIAAVPFVHILYCRWRLRTASNWRRGGSGPSEGAARKVCREDALRCSARCRI